MTEPEKLWCKDKEMNNKKVKILLIEDNPDHAELVRLMLAEVDRISIDLECADRLSTGLERIAKGGIDVILLDIMLPDSEGENTFNRVNDQILDVPIIVLSGIEDEITALKAIQAKAQDYLFKGQTDSNLLVHSICYAIERKKAEVILNKARDELEMNIKKRTAELTIVNKQLHFEINKHKRRTNERETLNIISQLFLTTNDLEYIYNEVPKILSTRLQFPIVAIELYDEKSKTMIFGGSIGIYRKNIKELIVPVDQTISGTVARTGNPVFEINASRRSEYRFAALRKLRVETFLCVPMNINNRVLGVLSLGDTYKRPDASSTMDIIQIIANQLAQEIKRKKVETTLQESEEHYRSLVENINLGITLIDSNFNIMMVNNHIGKRLNKNPREFIGKKCYREFEKRKAVCAHCPGKRAMATGLQEAVTTEGFLDDGTRVQVFNRAFPILGPNGKPSGFIEVGEDITERKKTKEILGQRVKELTTLNTLSQHVNASLSLDQVVQATIEGIMAHIVPDLVLLFLRKGNKLFLQSSYSVNSKFSLDKVRVHRVGECLCGKTASKGVATYSQNIHNDSSCVVEECKKAGFHSFAALPLSARGKIIGVLGLGSLTERDFASEKNFLEVISNEITIGLQNALLYENRKRTEELLRLIVESTAKVTGTDFLLSLVKHLALLFGFRYALIGKLIPPGLNRIKTIAVWANGNFADNFEYALAGTPYENVINQNFCIYSENVQRQFPKDHMLVEMRAESYMGIPLIDSSNNATGVLAVLHDEPMEELMFIEQIFKIFAERIVAEIERKRAKETLQNALIEIKQLKNRLQAENIYLQGEIKTEHNFEEIIGHSKEFKKVLHKAEQVASTDTTVLILGETGTGKELIARAIHHISKRKNRPLVKVNCASIPANLIESELFGHEKGAFTGAITRKTGRFELADRGTVFLDEIGDLPLDLQAKLLRILQDGEFERLGNSHTFKVDVRIIAATNSNLDKAITTGDFRQDLYYRLNVFPIKCPPLRNRKEDISLLVNHFIKKHSAKLGKTIDSVSLKLMSSLEDYHWPGNVRELENVIERAVILTKGSTLKLDELFDNVSTQLKNDEKPLTLRENERIIIQKALEECDWIVEGKRGAAVRLSIAPSTLRFRMKEYGFKRPNQKGYYPS
jgi:PAS domain S-box-containing protein